MSSDDPTSPFGPSWLAAWTAAADAAGVCYDGPATSVEVRIAGGPGGPLVWHARLEPGRSPQYLPGPAADAAASYDQGWADAVQQAAGHFDPCVAFMSGALKVKGATRPLYELFRLWALPTHPTSGAGA